MPGYPGPVFHFFVAFVVNLNKLNAVFLSEVGVDYPDAGIAAGAAQGAAGELPCLVYLGLFDAKAGNIHYAAIILLKFVKKAKLD